MPEGELEKVMVDFVDGRYDVLVCTTIIESGLDIPRANTMFVNRADRFGLAQLYQLRGRIGRSRERAFCYLVVPEDARITPEAKAAPGGAAAVHRARRRLPGRDARSRDPRRGRAAGRAPARRGRGGRLRDATRASSRRRSPSCKGEPIKPEHDPEITVDVPAFIPDDYVPDTGQRLEFYRRLAQARDEDDVRATLAELADRYGPLPDEAELLGEVMIDKTIVRALGALGLRAGPDADRAVVRARQRRSIPTKVTKLVSARGSRFKLTPDMRLAYNFDDREKLDRMPAARARLEQLKDLIG